MLRTRILSALVLAPLALAAIWFGSPWFTLLAALAGAIMGWEWARIVTDRFGKAGFALSVLAAAAAVLAQIEPAFAFLVLALAVAGGYSLGREQRDWLGLGAFYIILPVIALVWLRNLEGGLETVLWLMLLVWATDTGAYFAGRTIGGPRLAPRISPKKTWAGLIGGMLSAALVGAAVAAFWNLSVIVLVAVSALLAVVAQLGDLGESGVKRHFGVKDSSAIIPGHGGVLDRVDGIMPVAVVVAVVVLVMGGGVLQWH
ncbi:phosphatidate cytidylyltransferase [Telmatospirillum sp. J64-1]|uniref:phosphatidate cytidylyltransferase n=1 Tax=Telmatospirillum sp. J64-1 TaxID=2502183 RepID=UPI00115E0DA9|nr:phosphatidate cytidylyltransferase [Telmatospirillum sp. J64-1]